MRVTRRVAGDGSGYVKITVDVVEDMWHVYNLLAVGDRVRASTVRKVSATAGLLQTPPFPSRFHPTGDQGDRWRQHRDRQDGSNVDRGGSVA